VNLPTLVQLKLAARRYQDFADVVALIRANNLDEAFAEQLHTSVRQDYVECLEEKRREDEYETRQDEQMADQYPEEYTVDADDEK
jgi:cobalamin-dependent methionine synthase I